MAGAVLISTGNGVSLNSRAFDHIVDVIRNQFTDRETVTMLSVFRPYDEEGMMFITLYDLTSDEFNMFSRTVESARMEDVASNPDAPHASWDELSGRLAEDPRYRAQPST